jgi:hypothetical protein
MGWSIVGSTNFDLTGSAYLVSSGSSGSLNLGAGQEWWFEPEFGIHTFDHVEDMDRILVLRSDANPMLNSGLFRIKSVNSGSSSFAIDYRSPEHPPLESGSLTWYVFRSEGTDRSEIPAFNRTGNGSGNYEASGSSAQNSRIIFQSPTSASWQVRYCIEDTNNLSSTDGIGGCPVTIAPGFGGTSIGDYQVKGPHLHGAMHYDTNNVDYQTSTAGFFVTNADSAQFRFYAWGEDTFPGAMVFVSQNVETAYSAWAAFGFCEDESPPLPPKTEHRLFMWGAIQNSSPNNAPITWETRRQASDQAHGNTMIGLDIWDRVCLGNVATWCFLHGQTSTSFSPRLITANLPALKARDSTVTNKVELLPVDVMVGTWDNRQATLPTRKSTFRLSGRRVGRFPIARFGHGYGHGGGGDSASNATGGDFTLIEGNTDDWLHTVDGVYLPYSGTLLP